MKIELRELETEKTHEHCGYTDKGFGELIGEPIAAALCVHVAIYLVFVDDDNETGVIGKFCREHSKSIAAGLIKSDA